MQEEIRKARLGDEKSLEIIINKILNEVDKRKCDMPIATKWAIAKANHLKNWEIDDIISEMRCVIWKLIHAEKIQDLKLNGLKKLFWFRMNQVISSHFQYENVTKRTGDTVPIENCTFGKPSEINFEALSLKLTLEKLKSFLTPEQKFIVSKISEGYSLSEIARDLSEENNNNWYVEKVRLNLRKIRKMIKRRNTLNCRV